MPIPAPIPPAVPVPINDPAADRFPSIPAPLVSAAMAPVPNVEPAILIALPIFSSDKPPPPVPPADVIPSASPAIADPLDDAATLNIHFLMVI